MLKEIEEYAKEKNVPIMLKDGIEYLCNYIEKNQIKNILEIGTAIGYSAIKMALVEENIHVTSIERDVERYQKAKENIQKFHLEDRITLILGDALKTEVTGNYDLIFIDASKGHSVDFFEKYEPYLKKGGTIITDNLSFHGLVENEELAVTKNQKGLVKRIKKFIEFLENNHDYDTTYVEVGDKISISIKK
ncbi:MAG: O-methyltransferase [Bacilli bacterium]|nr:O-methyltransferase [Bacilli bacterium]